MRVCILFDVYLLPVYDDEDNNTVHGSTIRQRVYYTCYARVPPGDMDQEMETISTKILKNKNIIISSTDRKSPVDVFII